MSIVNTKKISNVQLTEEDIKQYKELSATRQEQWRLYPRLQYDITMLEYLRGLFYTMLYSPSLENSRQRIAKAWCPTQPERVVTALSVRTFIDAMLSVMALPAGSEVLMSSLTIPHMADILKYHKLVPRAFDIDFIEFKPNLAQCRSLISSKTKMMLVAPLFGRPMTDLAELSRVAKENGIMFVLDGAQSFSIKALLDEVPADVTMVSFGSIKFSTSLGGAIAEVADTGLAERIRAHLAKHTPRPWSTHAKNMLKYGFTISTDDPISFGILRNLFELLGLHFGEFVNKISRGFPGEDLMPLIRFQPPPAMMALLHYRITHISEQKRLYHCQSAWDILSKLPNYVQIVSAGDSRKPQESTFWLFAIYAQEPQMCYDVFQAWGIDAALGTSQMRSMGDAASCPNSANLMKHILYFPVYPEIGEAKRAQIVQLFKDIPRKMIESPSADFHRHVASLPTRHAYRSPEVKKLLKGHVPFKELPSGLLNMVAGPVVGTLLASKL